MLLIYIPSENGGGHMSDEPKGTYISLTEFAEDCGKTPLNILRKSIRLQRSAFVRLKEQGTLTIFDEIDR